MATIDESLISYAIRYEGLTILQQAGITKEHFVDEFRTVWNYLLRVKRQHDALPSADTLQSRFPDLELPTVRRKELPILLHDVRQRYKYIRLLKSLNAVADQATSYDAVDDLIQNLQGELSTLAFAGVSNHLVDVFGHEGKRRMLKDFRRRKSGELVGIPSGLPTFDALCGGLQKQKMITVIGRTGIGKSWLDLILVAAAVIAGAKVALYPLEMTLEEVVMRLYTIFSQEMFGGPGVLKNQDLTMGRITKAKMLRVLNALEDKYAGGLWVADVGSLSDSYTNERIEAEVELNQFDMFWVDYITLLKASGNGKNGDQEGWSAVRELSNGIATTAKRQNCIGGCSAQVNREAMRANVFLPRLEHISFGDSIGHDSDQVFSLNRKGKYLYYALVKNRGGPEISRMRMIFDVDNGILQERPETSEDAESE